MRNKKIIYWAVTGLMSAFMVMAAVPDVLMAPEAVEIIEHLGYPRYLIPFLGIAKLLGTAAILFPGWPRLKEWAYAGLVFDLIGALYSHLSSGDPISLWMYSVIGMILVGTSYLVWRLGYRGADPV